ncbi:amidohydrolase [Mycoplasmatota bacterium]|nr:amidohydrolase [Mycoplasmatota bacterium]
MKILFKNADILVGSNFDVLKNGFLGVENDQIIYISGEEPNEKYDIVKDMNNKVLMPGLVNSHTHSPMVLLRHVGGGLPLHEWLFDNVMPVEEKLTQNDIRIGTRLAMMEMISTGTVSFSDMYFEPVTQIEEITKAKMKANIPRPVLSFDPEEEPESNERFKESIELYDNYNLAHNGRIRVDFSIHAEYTSTEKIVRAYSLEAKKRNANVHVHVSETKKEHDECKDRRGKTPTKWFRDLGTLKTSCQFAHGVWLEDEDLEIIKENDVTVVHNPTSNMKLGSGFARVPKMIDMGINVTLGTDGTASNNNLNMFEEMHIAALIHKGKQNDPTVLSAKDIIKMATVNGAKMQGRLNSGLIVVGYKADIIALDFKKPHLIPNLNHLEAIVYSAQGSDVCMTMVDGEIIYEDGNYLTIDVDSTYSEIEKIIERLYEV